MRYNANGSLDTSFNGTGKVTTGFFGSSFDYGNSVAVQSDGKIVVAGRSASPGITRIALVRYNANGSLDTSFNGIGKVTASIGSGGAAASSMAIQSDGKTIVGGSSDNGSSFQPARVRYDANGSLDTSFNGTGTVTTSFGSGNDEGRSVAVQSDGKIVVAGYSTFGGGGDYDLALVRYDVDGSPDLTFSNTGSVTTAIGSSYDQGSSVALQSDGKIVVAGFSNNAQNNYDFALVRFQGGVVVPEPSTFALLGLVISVLFGSSRVRSRGGDRISTSDWQG